MNKQTNLWVGYFLGNAGLLMIYLLPQLVGTVTEQFNLSSSQSGFFASTDLIGSAIASLSSFFWIRKSNWRTMALVALGIIISGNLLSVMANSFSVLAACRILTGIGQGIAVALTLVIVNDSKNTDKNFAIYLILTLVFGALAVDLLPRLFSPLHSISIYSTQILVSLLTLPFVVKYMPKMGVLPDDIITDKRLNGVSLLCLFGVFVAYVGYGGLWALTERFGNAYGFSPDFIANVLTTGLLAAIPGLLIPIVIATKFGRAIPITIACVGLILNGILIYFGQNSVLFFVAVVFGSFGINMILPYVTGFLAEVDKTGKGVVMVMPMYAVGFAFGPWILSFFASNGEYLPISVSATIMFILVFFIFFGILFIKKNGK